MSYLGKKMPYIQRKSRYRNPYRGRNISISHNTIQRDVLQKCIELWPVPVKKDVVSMIYGTGLSLLLRYLQFVNDYGVPTDNDEWIKFHTSLFGDNYCRQRAISEIYSVDDDYDGEYNA